jgi:hypothetical protein
MLTPSLRRRERTEAAEPRRCGTIIGNSDNGIDKRFLTSLPRGAHTDRDGLAGDLWLAAVASQYRAFAALHGKMRDGISGPAATFADRHRHRRHLHRYRFGR